MASFQLGKKSPRKIKGVRRGRGLEGVRREREREKNVNLHKNCGMFCGA